MSMMVLSMVSLILSIWATAVIVRLDAATTGQKVTYIVLVWLVPIVGAVIALLGSLRFRRKKTLDTKQSMLEAIAEKHKTMKAGSV